ELSRMTSPSSSSTRSSGCKMPALYILLMSSDVKSIFSASIRMCWFPISILHHFRGCIPRPHDAASAIELPSNRSLLIPRPLVGSRARENAEHTVVPLVASVLEDRAGMARHGNLYGPGAAVHGRIRDGCSIEDRVRIGSGEALGDAQVLIGHSGQVSDTKSALVVELEVRRFDDKGVAFPVTSRITGPLRHTRREMRTAIKRNDPGLVIHLDEDRDVSGALNNAVIAVVRFRQHRRSGGAEE